MKWKVTLYNSGSNFDEIVHARQMSEAKSIALSRNPNSTFIRANRVFDNL